MTWTPPDPHRPVAKPSTGAARVGWRIAHSLWLLFPILSFGCLSAAGFLYVGLRAGRPSWWISGLVYSVLANVCFWVNGETQNQSLGTALVALLVFLVWPASIVHASIINASWLKWRESHQPGHTAYVGAPPPPAQLWSVGPPPDQFYAAPPVDLNTATEQQFATLPGFTRARAAHIVEARRSRGGFLNVNEFAAAAGLAPHEFAAVRDRLTCSPPLPPDDPLPGPYGRIVDV